MRRQLEVEVTGVAEPHGTCPRCGCPRTSPADLSADERIAAARVEEYVPIARRPIDPSLAVQVPLRADAPASSSAATASPALRCVECQLDFQPFDDPAMADYFARVHHEMHHAARPRRNG
jgi:hypothetical protein